MRAGNTNTQGPWELGRGPGQMSRLSGSRSDLTGEAGKAFLHQGSEDRGASEAPGRQSGVHVQWVRTHSHFRWSDEEIWISGLGDGFLTSTTRSPDPGEHSGAWGEFEGFQESSAKSEQLCQPFDLPERPIAPQPPRTASAQEHGYHQPHRSGAWVTGTTFTSSSEPIPNYENIFRFAFQDVPVQQATEDVFALAHFLEISSEEEPGLGSVHKWCSASRKFWRALQNANSISTSQCLWSRSHCQENFFLVLGVDAAQKNLSRGQGHVLEGSELKEPEEVRVHGSHQHHCGALIQTKGLSHRNGRCIPAPWRKKAFRPGDLKMTVSR